MHTYLRRMALMRLAAECDGTTRAMQALDRTQRHRAPPDADTPSTARGLASARCALIFYCDAAARPAGVNMIRPSSSARRCMETDLFGVADRQFEVRIRKPMSPRRLQPSVRIGAVDAEAVKLGNERRCALKALPVHSAPYPYWRLVWMGERPT
jgi:hypothetical protein